MKIVNKDKELEQAREEIQQAREAQQKAEQLVQDLKLELEEKCKEVDRLQREQNAAPTGTRTEAIWLSMIYEEQAISANLEKELGHWQARAKESEKLLNEQTQHCDALQKELSACQECEANLKQKLKDLTSQVEELNNKLQTASSSKNNLEAGAAAAAEAEIEERVELVARQLQAEYERERRAREELVRAYETSLRQKDRRIRDLSDQNDELLSRLRLYQVCSTALRSTNFLKFFLCFGREKRASLFLCVCARICQLTPMCVSHPLSVSVCLSRPHPSLSFSLSPYLHIL